MKPGVVVCLSVLAAVLIAPGAGAQQQQYPPAPARVLISTPGATITVVGRNWGPGTTVTVVRSNRTQVSGGPGAQSASASVLSTAVARRDGTFTANVTVPEDANPGTSFALVATGTDARGAPRTEVTRVDVTDRAAGSDNRELAAASDAQPGAGETARTGAPITNGLLLALGGLAAGAGLVVLARRRRAAG